MLCAKCYQRTNGVLLRCYQGLPYPLSPLTSGVTYLPLGPLLTVLCEMQVRERATLLLAELLTRLPKLPLSTASVSRFAEFFSSRLGDYPSVGIERSLSDGLEI